MGADASDRQTDLLTRGTLCQAYLLLHDVVNLGKSTACGDLSCVTLSIDGKFFEDNTLTGGLAVAQTTEARPFLFASRTFVLHPVCVIARGARVSRVHITVRR